MKCDKIKRYDADGNPVYKAKFAYDTLDDAILAAELLNVSKTPIRKLVAYKCNHCFKYHIGRGKKELTEKQRVKFKKQITNAYRFKI